jgi:ferredoxin
MGHAARKVAVVIRVVVDRELCEGNARCAQLAPEVFHVDDADKLHVATAIDATPELREKVEAAVALCPRQALSVIDGPD